MNVSARGMVDVNAEVPLHFLEYGRDKIGTLVGGTGTRDPKKGHIMKEELLSTGLCTWFLDW